MPTFQCVEIAELCAALAEIVGRLLCEERERSVSEQESVLVAV
jgi:hypothetical protein